MLFRALMLFTAALAAAHKESVAQERDAPVPIAAVRLLEPSVLPPAVDLPDLPVRPGATYSLELLQRTEQLITRGFARAGHPFARVEFITDFVGDPLVVDIGVRIERGPPAVFGNAVIMAPAPLSAAEARRWLPFAPGDPFTLEALEHAAERLDGLPVIRRVTVGAMRNGDVVVPTFVLDTQAVQGIGVAGTISSERCVSARVNWGHRHLFGAPRLFVLSGGGANLFAGPLRGFPCTGTGDGEFADPDYFVDAQLHEPLRPGSWLMLSGEVSRVSAPQAFIRRGYQVRAAVGHELRRRATITTAISPEHRDDPAAGPVLCGVHGICAGDPLADLLGRRPHTPLEFTLARAPLFLHGVPSPAPDAPLWLRPVVAPWRLGMQATLVGAVEGLLSDATYVTAIVDGTAARVVSPRFELAGRVRAGAVFDAGDPVPLQARLYGGGPLGVRGVLPNRLGPKVLTVPLGAVQQLGCDPVPGGCEGVTVRENAVRVRPAGGTAVAELSVEARTWALPWLQLSAFTDAGVLSSGAGAGVPVATARAEAVVTPGVGFMAVSRLGPIRVDVAYDPSPVRTYPLLTVGHDDPEHILLGAVLFDPYTFDSPSGLRELWRRLRFQLSMGAPF